MGQNILKGKNKVLFILGIIGGIFFYITPLAINIFYSFVENGYNIHFVGLNQYVDTLQDPLFWLALKNTFIFIGTGIPITVIFSYCIARLLILIEGIFKYAKLPFIITILLPTAAVAYTWENLFRIDGLINIFFINSTSWENKWQDMLPILFLFIWKNMGYCVLVFMVGFLIIPKEIYEAGMIDGAKNRKLERYITLPLMRGPIVLNIVISILQALKIGRELFILYEDQPKESIYMIQNYIREQFINMNVERMSSATIVFSSLVLGIIGIIYWGYRETEK